MRYQGKISDWRDEQGFGFVTRNGDGQRYFLHIKSMERGRRRPVLNDIVTFSLSVDSQGRSNATKVDFADHKRTSSLKAETAKPLYFSLAFCMLIVAFVIAGILHWKILGYYMVVNIIVWFLYMFDKNSARSNAQRTPENTLHIFSLLGGWPGALLAQRMFRHKSSKRSFQNAYWVTVWSHCAVFALLIILLTPQSQFIRNFISESIR